jgi:hypothetical protein
MAQTQGRYPLIDPKNAAGALWGIWAVRKSIDFLKDFDTVTDVDTIEPYLRLTHHRYQLLLGRAAKTVYATLLNGTKEEIERAIKFAFIILDAEKHLLDTNQAAKKYGFYELEQKYVKGEKDK